ncbi:uncharacterized protein LOC134466614 [Engraulis encrasicolus]|uniref:uncharacterized protein LOC134466614 n=1 Tax=Engraulis encrasicolus TaxID=184585 RepID=UPI002FCFA5BC
MAILGQHAMVMTLLILYVSHYLNTWLNPIDMPTKAAKDEHQVKSNRPIIPLPIRDGCPQASNWWMLPQQTEEIAESYWWGPVLQVLRIDKIKGWTTQEKGLLASVWDYVKNLFRGEQPANVPKPAGRKRTRIKAPSTTNWGPGCLLFTIGLLFMGLIRKFRRSQAASEATALEILNEQLDSQCQYLERMLDLLQQIQTRVSQMEECVNADRQLRHTRGKRTQKSVPMTFSDSSASSD